MKFWNHWCKVVWALSIMMTTINSLGKLILYPNLMEWHEIFVPFAVISCACLFVIIMTHEDAKEKDVFNYEYY